MPERSNSKGQTKGKLWSSRFGVGRGTKDPVPEQFTVTKPWRKPRHAQGFTIGKEEDRDNT
jgi:hypothetical protein